MFFSWYHCFLPTRKKTFFNHYWMLKTFCNYLRSFYLESKQNVLQLLSWYSQWRIKRNLIIKQTKQLSFIKYWSLEAELYFIWLLFNFEFTFGTKISRYNCIIIWYNLQLNVTRYIRDRAQHNKTNLFTYLRISMLISPECDCWLMHCLVWTIR